MSSLRPISEPNPISVSDPVPPRAVLPLVEARGYARLVAMNAMFDGGSLEAPYGDGDESDIDEFPSTEAPE